MNKGSVFTLVGIIVILLVVGFFTISTRQANVKDSSEAARALATTEATKYTDLSGNPVTFDEYDGMVRVVNSWASWCPFCVTELKDFETLAGEFKDQNVVVIAINRKEPEALANSFLATLGTFNHVVFIQDLNDTFYKSIGGFSMPETVFYDQDGNISTHKRGFMNLEEMRTLTEKAVNATNKE